MSFVRAQERMHALESSSPPAPAAGRELAETLLRQALQCLAGAPEYRLAGRLLHAGGLVAEAEPALGMALQAISQAGLASWDPSTDELLPTPLLAALMGIFDAATQTLPAQAPP